MSSAQLLLLAAALMLAGCATTAQDAAFIGSAMLSHRAAPEPTVIVVRARGRHRGWDRSRRW